MLLHKHHAEDANGEQTEVYVLHAAPAETQLLANILAAALVNNPDVPSYSITLGLVSDLDADPEPIIEFTELAGSDSPEDGAEEE